MQLHRLTWWTRYDTEEPNLTDDEEDDDDITKDTDKSQENVKDNATNNFEPIEIETKPRTYTCMKISLLTIPHK